MRGGDMLVADHRFKIHGHNNNNRFFFYRTANQTLISYFSAFMILLNASICTDHLKLGFYFNVGIVQAVLLTLIPLFLTQLSFYVYFRSWVFCSKFTYAGIWNLIFSPLFQVIPQFLVIYSFLNITFEIVPLIPDLWNKILEDLWDNVPSFLTNEWFVLYVIGFLAVFPFLFIKSFSALRFMSYVANFCLVLNIVCVIIDFCTDVNREKERFEAVKYFGGSFEDSMRLLLAYNQAFFLHPMLQLVSEDLENPTNQRISGLTWITNLSKFVIFNVISSLNYIQYFSVKSPNYNNNNYNYNNYNNNNMSSFIVNNNNANNYNNIESSLFDNAIMFMPKRKPLTVIIEVTTYINALISMAFFQYIIATFLIDIFGSDHRQSRMPTVMSGTCVFLLNCTVYFTSFQVRNILKVIGDICTCFLVYVLPPVFSICLYKAKDVLWFVLSVFLLVVGVPLTIMMIIPKIKDLM